MQIQKKSSRFIAMLFISAACYTGRLNAQQQPVFRDPSQPLSRRVQDLLNRLTPAEKVSLLGFRSHAVDRLSIPAYNWWNEALHGVARAGEATIFPQAIGMAATFNDGLLQEAAGCISTEARAKFNLSSRGGASDQYMGLTFWSPNINIFRDPRWGRGQETYGEDPFLTASMGTAFVRGMQGDNPLHLKTSACAKHFAVHSGPEADRHTFNAIVDEKDLRETYLYAFNKLVNAGVESIMCAYNRVNGEPCCSGPTLLHRILREEWHFSGHVVTDCGALDDIFERHKALPGPVETAAAAIKAGVNLDCSDILQDDALKAVDQGLLSLQDLDSALSPLLRTQMKLGFFDDRSSDPYSTFGADSIHTNYHQALSRKLAEQGMVLLKNENNILPLSTDHYRSIMIVGPSSSSLDVLTGNYHGVSPDLVTFVEGITRAAGPATRIEYDQGCNYSDTVHFGGTWAASNCDVTIAAIGLTPVMEGEEGDAFLAPHGGDKLDGNLPVAHVAYIRALRKAIGNKPLIAVVTAGSSMDLSSITPYVDGMIFTWYPGEQGGNALADILFGKISPSGHLPVTFYGSLESLPDYKDYSMRNRTYRYFKGPVAYPFGFGLSYTSFSYSWNTNVKARYTPADTISVTVLVRNTGAMDGDEVVQAYVGYPNGERMPLKELKAFKRISVPQGQDREVRLSIPVKELRKWDLTTSGWRVYPGKYKLVLGSDSKDEKLAGNFEIK